MGHTVMAFMFLVVFAASATAADPDPNDDADAIPLELTRPPTLPPFDPALMERIRAALAEADASMAVNTASGDVIE